MTSKDTKIEIDTEKLQKELPQLQSTAKLVKEMQQGNIPTNVAIEKSLEEAKGALDTAKHSNVVNPSGQKILEDTKGIVDSAKEWIKDKNQGDALRKLAEATQSTAEQARGTGAGAISYAKNKLDVTQLQKQARALLRETAALGTELSSSQAFRNSLWEFFTLLGMFVSDSDSVQEFLDKSTTKLTHKAEDLKEQLKEKIDQAADQSKQTLDEWTAKGQQAAQQAKQQGTAKAQHLRQGDTETLKGEARRQGEEARQQGERLWEQGKQTLREQAGDAQRKLEDWRQQGRNKLEEWRQQGFELRNIEGKPLTDEQLQQLQDKLRNVLLNITRRDSSKRATRALLAITDHLADVVKATQERAGAPGLTALQNDRNAQEILTQTRRLFERIAGGKSLDTLIGHIKALLTALDKDAEAKGFIQDLKQHMRDALEKPERLTDDAFLQSGRELFHRGRALMNKKGSQYRGLLNRILNEARAFVYAVQEDPRNKQLQQSIQRLLDDIFTQDAAGRLQLRSEAVDQLRLIMSNVVGESLRELPIPPLHIRDESRDVHLSNICVNIAELAPEQIRIDQSSSLGIQLKDKPSAEVSSGRVTLYVENMKTTLKGMHFDYKSLSFPKIEDSGTLDLDIGGDGVSLTLTLDLNTNDMTRPLTVSNVDVNIDKLNLHVQETKRDWFNNMVLWFWSGVMKRRLQRAIEDQMRSFFEDLNENIAAAATALQQAQLPSALQGLTTGTTSVTESVKQTWESAKSKGQAATETAKQQAQTAWNQTKGTAQQLSEKAKTKMEE